MSQTAKAVLAGAATALLVVAVSEARTPPPPEPVVHPESKPWSLAPLRPALETHVAEYVEARQTHEWYSGALEAERQREAAQAAQEAREAAPVVSTAGGSVWDRLAACESGGNWSINTGNGYFGGLQFNLQTWHAYGGTGYPHEHSRATQIAVAERLRAARGFQPWPACSRKLGL